MKLETSVTSEHDEQLKQKPSEQSLLFYSQKRFWANFMKIEYRRAAQIA